MPQTPGGNWKYNDLPGYIENRGRRCRSRWLYKGRKYSRSHPFPLEASNRRVLKKLHRQFVEAIVSGEYETKEERQRPARVYAAINEFFKVKSGELTAASTDDYDRAFSYYLDVDLPLSHESLYRHLLTRLDTPAEGRKPLAQETRRKYMIRLRAFGQWLADRGYLDRSPYATVSIPPPSEVRKRITGLFTTREILEMARWHRRAVETVRNRREAFSHIQQAIAIELAYLTGMRPSELCRSRWEDLDDSTWLIWGKASPARAGSNQLRGPKSYRMTRETRDDHARQRGFPIGRAGEMKGLRARWQRSIATVLDEARQYTDITDGWIIDTKHPQVLNRGVHAALAGLEIDRGDRSFRRVRHSARRMMEEDLRLDPITISDLLGHTPEVSLRSYRAEPSADDIARRMR